MAKESAGLLMYRTGHAGCEVLLAHPGGPFWAKKDAGAWSIPKGEIEPDEEPLAAAIREFREETGHAPAGTFIPLGQSRQGGGKLVHAWAVEGHFDPNELRSTVFSMEWPPKSGRLKEFPEIDRAAFFSLDEARTKILTGQAIFLERLQQELGRGERS